MAIRFNQVSFEYSPNTPFAHLALKDIDLVIPEGKVTAIIGETGSGKSTLVQHLNALLIPTSGSVEVGEKTIQANEKNKGLKELRKKVGLVFQFPEYQLFEETILEDVAFGPKNFGVSDGQASLMARQALRKVGLDSSYETRSPLELSGGQKRRVAIAGILAMNPDVLVLDEPTAGLDPVGTKKMMDLFMDYNKDNKTIVMVTHNMEHVMTYCEDVVVLKEGKVVYQGTAKEFFHDEKALENANMEAPLIIQLQQLLKEKGLTLPESYFDVKEFVQAIKKEKKR